MTDLIRLAERVEGLAGPDRDLDFQIAMECNIDIRECCGHGRPTSDDGVNITGEECCGNPDLVPPSYTASLDAAMTLVPEGFKWRCGYSRHVPHNAEVVDYNSHKGTFIGESDSNRACALTAAALRAIEAHRGQG